jgi:phosphate transport system ATP-binding protein
MSESAPILETRNLGVRAGSRSILRNVNLTILRGQIFGLIGPSGAGKSTLIRCFNRLNDLVPGLTSTGDVLFHSESVLASQIDVNALRARIGMLFQQPVIFPASIRENVLFGAKRLKPLRPEEQTTLVEASLREAALWEEVKDRLKQPATNLSVGQQQRLCLARALAVQPEVILMDEPTSALDPRSAEAIEELLLRLKSRVTIVIVTHNLAQAARITDNIAFVCTIDGVGEVAETGPRDKLLTNPESAALADYLKLRP